MRVTAQWHDGAVLKGLRLGQAVQPRCDPAAVLLGEFLCFPQTAARRHGQHDLAGRRLDPERVAARLPVAPHPHQIDILVVDDLDRLRFGRPPVEERAERHVTLDCFGLRYCHRPIVKHPFQKKIKQAHPEV